MDGDDAQTSIYDLIPLISVRSRERGTFTSIFLFLHPFVAPPRVGGVRIAVLTFRGAGIGLLFVGSGWAGSSFFLCPTSLQSE